MRHAGGEEECVDPPEHYKRLLQEGGPAAVRAAMQQEGGGSSTPPYTTAGGAHSSSGSSAAGSVTGKRGRSEDDAAHEGAVQRAVARARLASVPADVELGLPPRWEETAAVHSLPRVESVPRYLPPRVHMYSTGASTDAQLDQLPLGLRALLSSAATPVRDVLLPRMSIGSFVSFWRLTWQRLGASALSSKSATFFREVGYDEPLAWECGNSLDALLREAVMAGVAPIPEDALAVLLPPPDTSGVSEPLAAAMQECHAMLVDWYASEAVEACSVPITRGTWFRASYTPFAGRCNAAMSVFCTSVAGMRKQFATGAPLVWLSPDGVMDMVQARWRGRAQRLRQYCVTGPVLQQVYDPMDDSFLGYRRILATHVVRNEFWPDGCVRSTTMFHVDVSPVASTALMPQSVAASGSSLITAIAHAPMAYAGMRNLLQASAADTVFRALLWQSHHEPQLLLAETVRVTNAALQRVPVAMRTPLRSYGTATFTLNDPVFSSIFETSILSSQLAAWHRVVALRYALQGFPCSLPHVLPSVDELRALAQCVDIVLVTSAAMRITLAAGATMASTWSAAWTDMSVLQPTQAYADMIAPRTLRLSTGAAASATSAVAASERALTWDAPPPLPPPQSTTGAVMWLQSLSPPPAQVSEAFMGCDLMASHPLPPSLLPLDSYSDADEDAKCHADPPQLTTGGDFEGVYSWARSSDQTLLPAGSVGTAVVA